MFILFIASSVLYEVTATQIMDVIGDFYTSINDQNTTLFFSALYRSFVVVSLVAVISLILLLFWIFHISSLPPPMTLVVYKIDVLVSVYLWWGEGVFGLEREFDFVHPL